MGLDGRPRPINIAHGANVIQWNRTESWVKEELINKVSVIGEGDSWREEKTGLHEWEFIETRRHWFTDKVLHKNESGVNVLNLIEGRSVIVESPIGQFCCPLCGNFYYSCCHKGIYNKTLWGV